MADKLNTVQVLAFARMFASSVEPLNCTDNCRCDSACGCDNKEGCCENKCGCDGKENSGPTEALLNNPDFRAILESFDPNNIKTITQFLALSDSVRTKIKKQREK